jgi:type VI secretion system protein VasI
MLTRTLTTSLVISFLLPISAIAGQIEECTKVASNTERLACYDLAAGRTPESVAPSGKWVTTDKKNPIDDTTTRVAYIEADGTTRSVTLIARCMSNKTEVYINWDKFLGDDDRDVYSSSKNVIVRFDEEKSKTQKMGTSTDHKATFVSDAVSFLRSLSKSKKLVLQTTPYGESPVTAIFDVTGANDALKGISDLCKWKLG